MQTQFHFQCVENISRSNCPVCLGDIHTSRYPCHIPDCGHLLHKTCFDQLVSNRNQANDLLFTKCVIKIIKLKNSLQLASGHYVCPTCQTSMIDMTKLWDYLDTQAQNLPVPKSHENSIVDIFCNDCFKVNWRLLWSLTYFIVNIFMLFFSNQQSNSILLDWNVLIVVVIIQPKT